jgi:hypothetical protein
MSFVQSNITSGNNWLVSLSGLNGVAGGSSNLGIYYTIDSGQNWLPSTITTGATNTTGTGNFFSIFLSGLNGVAGSGSNLGLYYTSNGGQSWVQSNRNTGYFISISLDGSNGIACSGDYGGGMSWTQNFGQTWTVSRPGWFPGTSISEYFATVSFSGQKGIAGSTGSSFCGLLFTNDGGRTFNFSNINSGGITGRGSFFSVSLSGNYGAAASSNNSGVYYSADGGVNWNISPSIPTASFKTVQLIGLRGCAGSWFNTGMYYTINGGQTWLQSNLKAGSFEAVYLTGNKGILGSATGTGIYTTNNYGQSWNASNISTGSYKGVSIDPISEKGIAGGISNTGLYYTSGQICYEKNTLILVLENEQEVYKKICELKVGDIVKTYKRGYKKIRIIKSFKYMNNDPNVKKCLYKMRDHNIIVTANHSILVDKLSDEEKDEAKKFKIIIKKIEDKYLLPACVCDNFDKIINNQQYELWHFALENDDINKNYGVYITDGVLSESCSEANLKEK